MFHHHHDVLLSEMKKKTAVESQKVQVASTLPLRSNGVSGRDRKKRNIAQKTNGDTRSADTPMNSSTVIGLSEVSQPPVCRSEKWKRNEAKPCCAVPVEHRASASRP